MDIFEIIWSSWIGCQFFGVLLNRSLADLKQVSVVEGLKRFKETAFTSFTFQFSHLGKVIEHERLS